MGGAVYVWSLNLNIDKCEFMRFTRSRAAVDWTYSINSVPLTKVSSHKHLSLVWLFQVIFHGNPMFYQLLQKRTAFWAYFKRTFGRCSEAIKMGYIYMVRPMIEYACPVWNPHQQSLSDKLERIQRYASRWILSKDILSMNICRS
mgnify:CR=1 FL=1